MYAMKSSSVLIFWFSVISQSHECKLNSCFHHSDQPGQVGVIIQVLATTERYPFQKTVREIKAGFQYSNHVLNDKAELEDNWINSQSIFYMICAKLTEEGKESYRAIIYLERPMQYPKYLSIKTMDVQLCGTSVAKAVTIVPIDAMKYQIRMVNLGGHCSMDVYNIELQAMELENQNCHPLKRREHQTNNEIYTNGWKKTNPINLMD